MTVVSGPWPPDVDYHGATDWWGSTMISRFRKDRWQLFLELSGRAPAPKISAGPLGLAFENVLLEKSEGFAEKFVVAPDAIKRGRSKAWTDFEARAAKAGQEPLEAGDLGLIDNMVVAAHKHPDYGKFLDLKFESQAAFRWTDPETGVQCKFKPDYMLREKHVFIDNKSISGRADESPMASVEKSIVKYGYHRQLALYSIGYEQMFGTWPLSLLAFTFKEPPHHCILVELDKEAMDLGVTQVREALSEISDVLSRVEDEGDRAWRAPFASEVRLIPLPRYAFYQ